MYNSSDLTNALLSVSVTGMKEGERILGIDVRVSNNKLYALGNQTLYTIDPLTGVATEVGPLTGCPAVGLNYISEWSFNIDPKTDGITIVTAGADNWRVHPGTGACTVKDNRYFDKASGAGYCGGQIAYNNNLPNLPASINSTQYTIEGWFMTVPHPNKGDCHIINVDDTTASQQGLDGPFDIYTSLDYLNVPFIIRDNTLVTFSLVDGWDQVNVRAFQPLASGLGFSGLSTLPPGYNPLSPTAAPTSRPKACRVSVSFAARTGPGSSWTSDGQEFQIYDITVTNTGSKPATSFSAYSSVLASSVQQAWNYAPATGDFSNFGDLLAAGSSFTGAGFIYPVPTSGSTSFTRHVTVSEQC